MVLEHEVLPYLQWLLYGGESDFFGALPRFLLVFAGVLLLVLLVGFSIAAARRGLMRGGDYAYRTVASGLGELFQTSPRRVWALARLAIKEGASLSAQVLMPMPSDKKDDGVVRHDFQASVA